MKTASAMRTALVTLGFLIVAAFFLTTEHRAHLFGLLPYLLLLACPLLHLFGHGGHGGHGNDGGHTRDHNTAPRARDKYTGRALEGEDAP